MEREQVFEFVKNCMNGEPASCIVACPFHLDVKAILKKTAKGRLASAQQDLHKALPFPGLISQICPAPCEGACQRYTVLKEETISIRMIEQACLNEKEKKTRKSYTLPPLETKVAVVGAGPVGLCSALHLSRKRYQVTVYERASQWGGSLANHKSFANFDMEFMKKFEGEQVEFLFDTEITNLQQLEDFDMILIASGIDGEDFGLLDSCNKELGSTEKERVFLAGQLLGHSLIDGMAHSNLVTKAMESYLQTGAPEHALVGYEKLDCVKNAPHDGEEAKAHIIPAGQVYTKEEATTEAERCMLCDCNECVNDCSMLEKFKKKPPRIAIDVAQDGMTRNSVSSACITRQTWSCNLCGHCANVCQEGVDVGGMFELSRLDRVASGNYPPAFHGYWMDEMNLYMKEGSLVRSLHGESCDYLFFPGCRLGGANPDYVLKSFDYLIQLNGRVGMMLECCGIPALWAGEGEKFEKHIALIRSQWEALGSPAIVYACSSCLRTFKRFLPEIPVISLYELLETRCACGTGDVKYSVFDPCSATGYKQVKDAVRNVAESIGYSLSDYDSNGKCCGFGGHIQQANPDFYDEITNARCQESELPYLVYCVNCKDVFASGGKAVRHILDLYFNLEDRSVQTLEEKRQNLLYTKQKLLQTYWQEETDLPLAEWENIKVHIPEGVQREMERGLIPARDVKKTIWINEKAGEGFINEEGQIICRMISDYITLWVMYQKEGDVYQILQIYSHRMKFREEEI